VPTSGHHRISRLCLLCLTDVVVHRPAPL